MTRYKMEKLAISASCALLLCGGLSASLLKLGADQGWFARAGGLVAMIAGWWLVVAADRERKRIEEWAKTKSEEEAAYWQSLKDSDAERAEHIEKYGTYSNFGEQVLAMATRESVREVELLAAEFQWSIRRFELRLLGLGTLVWALGDLVKFLPV